MPIEASSSKRSGAVDGKLANRTTVRARTLGVLLMVVLSAIKRPKWRDLRHDLVRLLLLRAHDGRTRGVLLCRGLREDRAAILIAIVRALAVQSRGVVDVEEYVEQAAVAHALRIELDQHGFGMTRVVLANAGVGRIGRVPTGVAHRGCGHPWHVTKRIFDAP